MKPDETQVIDQALVKHVAYLIRLALTDEEVALFTEQLGTIVGYFDRLAEVDVVDVPPYRQAQMGRAHLREDRAQPSLLREDFLANAPQQQDGFVRVPVALDVPDEA